MVRVEASRRASVAAGVAGWRASLLVAAGLWFVYQAKVQRMAGGPVLNVNAVASPDELLPVLEFFPNRAELAPRVYEYLERARPLRNAGALTAVIPRRQFARVKPLIAVRTAAEFRARAGAVGAALLCGILARGAALAADAISRRRRVPARAAAAHRLRLSPDGQHARSAARHAGVPQVRHRRLRRVAAARAARVRSSSITAASRDWCYTPLFAALALFGLLMAFGRGPAGNDAKVNLGIFQPVELIKILLVMFLAGYFTRNWERLRDLREKRAAGRTRGARRSMCFRCWWRRASRSCSFSC